jgi:hypothetical protein
MWGLMSLEFNNSCVQAGHLSKKSLWNIFSHELMHHLPYGTLSVACAMMLLTMIAVLWPAGSVEAFDVAQECCEHGHDSMMSAFDILFHSFHFTHILFAASGAMVTFYRYSNNVVYGIFVGIITSSVFCTLSDILLPYAAGSLLGVDMDLHICFSSELTNIVPFLLIGVINGFIISRTSHASDNHGHQHSISLHFFHTFISAMASIFYTMGHGLPNFYEYFGLFFLLMLVAVVIPCTLSDVVFPILWAKMVKAK